MNNVLRNYTSGLVWRPAGNYGRRYRSPHADRARIARMTEDQAPRRLPCDKRPQGRRHAQGSCWSV